MRWNSRDEKVYKCLLICLAISYFEAILDVRLMLSSFQEAYAQMNCFPISSDKKTLKRWLSIDKMVG